MTKVSIQAGICGFTTVVTAEKKENYTGAFQLTSECPNWTKLNEILGGKEIDMMKELFKDRETGVVSSLVIETALKHIPHVSCPVMSGILKAMEASVGLALPKDSTIHFTE